MMIKRIGYHTMCKQSGKHVRKRKDDMPKFGASYRRRGQYYKKELKDCGFTRPFFSHYGGWIFIGMVAIIDKHSGYSDLTKQVVRKVVTRISSKGSSEASFTYSGLAASTPANKDLVSWR
jgi:hypothetical protein